jgi:hypothetical protein
MLSKKSRSRIIWQSLRKSACATWCTDSIALICVVILMVLVFSGFVFLDRYFQVKENDIIGFNCFVFMLVLLSFVLIAFVIGAIRAILRHQCCEFTKEIYLNCYPCLEFLRSILLATLFVTASFGFFRLHLWLIDFGYLPHWNLYIYVGMEFIGFPIVVMCLWHTWNTIQLTKKQIATDVNRLDDKIV